MRRLCAAIVSAALLVAPVASGAPPTPVPPTPPKLALPLAGWTIFGQDAPTHRGWIEVVARIDNPTSSPQKGEIELKIEAGGHPDQISRAPFNIPAGRSAVVRLPTQAPVVSSASLTARGEHGAIVAAGNVAIVDNPNGLLVDVSQPSRLLPVLRGWPFGTAWHRDPYFSPSTGQTVAVGAPVVDATTGDPVLPDVPVGYANAAVVLIHSERLAKLEGMARDALVHWVLAGGTLAVVLSRPEDLRGPVLSALLGGAATLAPPPSFLPSLPSGARPSTAPPALPTMPTDDEDSPIRFDANEPENAFIPIRAQAFSAPFASSFVPVRTTPAPFKPATPSSSALLSKLTGYTGGNLRPSRFGATASYGLGEVHMLAFDPTERPMVDEPWTHVRLVEMVSRAMERGQYVALPHGGPPQSDGDLTEIRRALDPNENFRLALGIAAIVLVAYSLLAGPVTFLRANKQGKPLAPLKWVPLWSAATFLLIVLIGLAGKGFRGRARHLAVVETGAGMTRGPVRRFRGFFTSRTRNLAIPSTDRTSVLSVATKDSARQGIGTLRFDRNGSVLEGIVALPWQTVVVREDGFADLGGGIAVSQDAADVKVTNRTGKNLRDVLVHIPGAGLYFFETVKNGATIDAHAGRVALPKSGLGSFTIGTTTYYRLSSAEIAATLSGAEGARISAAWHPLEEAAGRMVNWWPDDVPAVIAEVEGGEGTKSDSGLFVESDRMLVRVLGVGGAP